jgi:nitric oxide reductase activation protein
MGRDKKNPKPLDTNAFNTLVKTAAEVLRRHEQQLQAQLHKQITVDGSDQRILVSLDIEPDDDAPAARLSAHDAAGALLAQVSVSAGFKLDRASASAWIANGYVKPAAAG